MKKTLTYLLIFFIAFTLGRVSVLSSDKAPVKMIRGKKPVVVAQQNKTAVALLQRAAREEKKNKKKALNDYGRILRITNDPTLRGQSYQRMSFIYHSMGNDKKALECAQKAYNTKPNLARTVFLAKLYHLSGDTANCDKYVNIVLNDKF